MIYSGLIVYCESFSGRVRFWRRAAPCVSCFYPGAGVYLLARVCEILCVKIH